MTLNLLQRCWVIPACLLMNLVSAGKVELPSFDKQHGVQQHSRRLEQGHLQSGPDTAGSSFAAASFVDAKTGTLHIVGTTYGKWWSDGGADASNGADDPACFYSVAQLPSGDTGMQWLHSQTLGKAFVEQGCLGLFLNEQRAFVLGYSPAEDGLLSSIFNPSVQGAEVSQQIGMILDYKFDASSGPPSTSNPLDLQGGLVSFGSKISYPVAISGLPGSNEFYVAYMESFNGVQSNEWAMGAELDPANVFEYGNAYFMSMEQYIAVPNPAASSTLQKTIQGGGTKKFGNYGKAVEVTGLLRLTDRLIVAGYTEAVGAPFSSPGQTVDGINMDGFITQLSLETMEPLAAMPPTYRVATGTDDYVTDICVSPKDQTHVFVTGYTKGHLLGDPGAGGSVDSIRAFIMKLRLSDMEPMWVQELEATPAAGEQAFVAKAISCAVTNNGAYVYVVGDVEQGGHMTLDTEVDATFGGTDVWIAQIGADSAVPTTDGKIIYVNQFGSEENDTVAHRGGVQVDANNNAVMTGNTLGSIYRDRPGTEENYADVFVAIFEYNTGTYTIPLEHDNFVSLPPQATRAPAVAAPPVSRPAPAPTPVAVPAPTPVSKPTPKVEDHVKEESSGNGNGGSLLMILVLGIVGVLAFLFYWNCIHLSKRDAITDRSKVLDYLHNFDVEDVELKHSATGGWHCTYVNDLANGLNKQVQGDDYRNLLNNAGDTPASAYDPLTTSSTHSMSSGRRGYRNRARRNNPNSDYDEGGLSSDDEEVVTFGETRDVRKERKSNIDRFIKSSGDDDKTTESNRRARRTRSAFARSSASVSSADSGPVPSDGSRVNKAKERWENREII